MMMMMMMKAINVW